MAPVTRSMDRPKQVSAVPSVTTTQSSKPSKKTGNSSIKKVTTETKTRRKATPKKTSVKRVKKPALKKAATEGAKNGGRADEKTTKPTLRSKSLNPEIEHEKGPGPEHEDMPYIPRSPTGNTQHGQIGFDRRELQDSGSLELDGAHVPTLSNDIHAI